MHDIYMYADPMVDGQLVAAGIGCYVPFLKNPYGSANLIVPRQYVASICIILLAMFAFEFD
jgi:hypothetical protein